MTTNVNDDIFDYEDESTEEEVEETEEVEEESEESEEEETEEVEEKEEEKVEEKEAKKQRKESQIDRLKKENAELKAKARGEGNEDITLARLETRGVMNADDQAYVLKFAKSEGISPVDALNDKFVSDRLAHFAKERKVAGSTPAPKGRTGKAGQHDLARAVAHYNKTGNLPNDPQLTSKVLGVLERESE